jgi:hypothetical protein
LIIDECQDMTDVLHEFVVTLLGDLGYPQMCCFGDKNQSIYGFKNADPRYITLAHKIWPDNKRKWISRELRSTYRLPPRIAAFVNDVLLGEDRLRSAIDDNKLDVKTLNVDHRVLWYRTGFYRPQDHPVIVEIARILSYKDSWCPEDIFILTPSVKAVQDSANFDWENMTPAQIYKTNPTALLANALTRMGHKIYIPNSDDEVSHINHTRGKIIFTTFHQSKGMERKFVFIDKFESTYSQYYARDTSPTVCPNQMYVAATRAKVRLYVMRAKDKGYPTFCKKIGTPVSEVKAPGPQKLQTVSVTNFVKYLPCKFVEYIINEHFVKRCVQRGLPKSIIDIRANEFTENVSALHGLAIPALFEFDETGAMSIFSAATAKRAHTELANNNAILDQTIVINGDIDEVPVVDAADATADDTRTNMFPAECKLVDALDIVEKCVGGKIPANISIADALFLANLHSFAHSDFLFKLSQIKRYDWLNTKLEAISAIHEEMRKVLPKGGAYEKSHSRTVVGALTLCGRFDYETDDQIWEFKCAQGLLTDTHILQLAVYGYLAPGKKMFLYNLFTHEILEICESHVGESCAAVVADIIAFRANPTQLVDDKLFVEERVKVFSD